MFGKMMNMLREEKKPSVTRKPILEKMFEEGQRARLAGLSVNAYYRPLVFSNAVVANVAAQKEGAWRNGWHHMDKILTRAA